MYRSKSRFTIRFSGKSCIFLRFGKFVSIQIRISNSYQKFHILFILSFNQMLGFFSSLCRIRLKKYDDAVIQYEKAVKMDPTKTDLYKNISSAYEQKNDYKKAISAYQKYYASLDKEKQTPDLQFQGPVLNWHELSRSYPSSCPVPLPQLHGKQNRRTSTPACVLQQWLSMNQVAYQHRNKVYSSLSDVRVIDS